MEAQLHRTNERDHEDPLHSTDVHGEEKRGGETKSTMKKVKEKVDKLKATMKHGRGSELKDEAETVNNSSVVRSGLVEPTVMGTPVLAEDLYATHSDILDPPVRSFAQWQEEEKRGSPPPLSTNYETRHTDKSHGGPRGVDKEQLNIGKHTHVQEEKRGSPPPLSANYEHGGPRDVDREQLNIGKHTHVQEEKDDAQPPPLCTAFETRHTDMPHGDHHTYGGDVNRDQLKGSVGGLKDEGAPPSTGYESLTDQDVNRGPLMDSFGNPTGKDEEGRYGAPFAGYQSRMPAGEGIYGAPQPPSGGYQGQMRAGMEDEGRYVEYDQVVNRGMEEGGIYGAPPPPNTGINYETQRTSQSQVSYDAYGDEDLNSYPVPTGISTQVVEEDTTDTGGRQVRITEATYIRRN